MTIMNCLKMGKFLCVALVAAILMFHGNFSEAAGHMDPEITVQMFNTNRLENTDKISMNYNLVNSGGVNADFQDLKIRYYLTSDDSNVLSYDIDSSSPTINNTLLATFVKLDKPIKNADYFIEIGFDEFAGILEAGDSVKFSVSINKNINGNFTQSNDYSYNKTSDEYVGWNKVTAYYGGKLIWGEEISEFVPPSENFALKKPVTASSTMTADGWAAEYIVDGERRSIDGTQIGWGSEPGDEQWVMIDMGAITQINRVDLYAINWISSSRGRNGIVGEGYPIDFKIQVSGDDNSWTTVSTQTDVLRPTVPLNSYVFNEVDARYVRIVTTKNRPLATISDTRAAISEVEIYYDKSYTSPSTQIVPLEGRAIITPAEFTGAIQNPLMGMATKDFRVNLAHEWSLDYMPWASLAMTYIPWDLLENDVDDTIDKIINYSNARWGGYDTAGQWRSYEDLNIKVIPRVYLKFPDDPFFGLEGSHWPDDMAANNFTSDDFDKRLKRLIQRLGTLWDNDPRVAYIKMGLYGTWGEQHGTAKPVNVDAYFHQYFPNKQVQVRYEGQNDYSFGQYNDSMGNMRVISNWKKQAVGGEPAYDYNGFPLHGENPHLTMIEHYNNAANMIRNVHAVYLTWIGEYTYRVDPGYPGLSAYYANKERLDFGAETVQKAFGYRYVITEFNYPEQINPGEDFAVQFKVKNTGATPMYYNWPIELSLKDPESNEIIWRNTCKDVDIREWMPGEGYASWNKATTGNWSSSVLDYTVPPQEYTVTDSFSLPSSIDTSKDYIIQLAVLDPAGNVPSLRFAIENYKAGGYAPMGYVGLGKTPATIELNPAYFDSPAKDISLRYFTENSPIQAESARLDKVTVSGLNPTVYVESGKTFNLDQLTIIGTDQFGYEHNVMVGLPVTWSIASGDQYATITGNQLTPGSVGSGTLTATINGVVSNEFDFFVEQTSGTGSITGQIKDNFNRLLQGVRVSVVVDGTEYYAETDAIGVYQIVHVPTGSNYTITAAKEGYQEESVSEVRVEGDTATTANIVIKLEPAGPFFDDFSNGNGNWTTGTGSWTVNEGEYVQTGGSGSNSWKYSTTITDKVWYDAIYEVDLKAVADTSWASFMFRKQSPSHTADGTGYFVMLRSNGNVDLQKAGKTLVPLATVTNALTSMTEYHHLKIVTEGINIKVYVDGQDTPIIDVNDSSYTGGYAGLGNGGARWHYDNVTVTPVSLLD